VAGEIVTNVNCFARNHMAFEIPLLSCAHNPIVIPHGFVYPCFAVFTKQLLVRDRNQKKKYMGRMYCVLATKDQRHVFSGSGALHGFNLPAPQATAGCRCRISIRPVLACRILVSLVLAPRAVL
jgi:hypothetical protein